jgi:hypothetical protein
MYPDITGANVARRESRRCLFDLAAGLGDIQFGYKSSCKASWASVFRSGCVVVTMVPAFVVVALGVNATDALVYSPVVLSFALPVPMIALAILTCRRGIMGPFVNSRVTAVATIVGTAIILALNIILLLQTFGVAIPGLPNVG